MLLQKLTLGTIDRTKLRLVMFATQGAAVAFVRDALAATPDADGIYAEFRADSTAIAAIRQAVCRVAGTKRTILHRKGDVYTVARGDRKGQKVTAAHDVYRQFTLSEYDAAMAKLGIALVEDASTVTTTTKDGKTTKTASYALRKRS